MTINENVETTTAETTETTVETKRKFVLPKISWVKVGITAAAVAAAATAVVILLKKKNSSEAGSEATGGSE